MPQKEHTAKLWCRTLPLVDFFGQWVGRSSADKEEKELLAQDAALRPDGMDTPTASTPASNRHTAGMPDYWDTHYDLAALAKQAPHDAASAVDGSVASIRSKLGANRLPQPSQLKAALDDKEAAA